MAEEMSMIAERDDFTLFERKGKSSLAWKNLKLIRSGKAPKHNWWLGWNGERMGCQSRPSKIGRAPSRNSELGNQPFEGAINVGRRKSLAQREPNGRVQRVPEYSPSEVRRLRDAALSGMRDPLWGTELGRLYLVGKITTAMYAAGKRWAELSVKYSQALCSPSPDPRAVCMDRMGGERMDPDSYEGRREVRRHERAVASFIDAHAALKTASMAAERVVRSMCERNEILIGHEGLICLSSGLLALAHFWGLTDSRKSTSDRQA